MKKLFVVLMSIGLIFAFISCNDMPKDVTEASENSNIEKYANDYLEIVITKNSARKVYYDAAEITNFNLLVDFDDAGIEDLNANFGPKDTYSFNIFKNCSVLLKLSAVDSSSNKIGYGEKQVSFTVGNDVFVTVAVDMLPKETTVTVGGEINEPQDDETGGDETGETESGGEIDIDYTDYSGKDFSIKVYNESSKNVVCFQNRPRESNLISGVKAGATVGLKKNSLFSNTHDFILFVVTEEDYLANKNDLSKLDNNPFASLYACYNAESAETTANMVYHISKNMGGEYYILINNNTNYNVELRQNGLYGDALAFAGHHTLRTRINMVDGDYYIYPVFRKYSKKYGEIITTFPKFTVDGNDYPVVFEFSLDDGLNVYEFNVNNMFVDWNASEAATAAYVAVYNANAGTEAYLHKGANAEAATTSTGGKIINSGKTLLFEVPMVNLGNQNYSSNVTVSGWRIGTPTGKNVSLETIEVDAGKIYYIEIAGTDYTNITASWKKSNGLLIAEEINIEDEPLTDFR